MVLLLVTVPVINYLFRLWGGGEKVASFRSEETTWRRSSVVRNLGNLHNRQLTAQTDTDRPHCSVGDDRKWASCWCCCSSLDRTCVVVVASWAWTDLLCSVKIKRKILRGHFLWPCCHTTNNTQCRGLHLLKYLLCRTGGGERKSILDVATCQYFVHWGGFHNVGRPSLQFSVK